MNRPLIDLMKEAQTAGLGYPGSEKFPAMSVAPGFNQPNAVKAWILTYTGRQFYHLDPRPEMVCIYDIAHALSQLCRWTGHTRFLYSVAQHSWYCSYLVPREFALAALLHDASEAYLGDMNRPLKHYTAAGPAYMAVEAKVEEVIFGKFGLQYPMPEIIKQVDTQMLYAERYQLLNVRDVWYEPNKWGYDDVQASVKIEEITPRFAEEMFLSRFNELYQGEHKQCRFKTQ